MYKILNVTTGEYIVSMFRLTTSKGYHIYRDPLYIHNMKGFEDCLFFTKLGAYFRLWISFRKTRHLYLIVKV